MSISIAMAVGVHFTITLSPLARRSTGGSRSNQSNNTGARHPGDNEGTTRDFWDGDDSHTCNCIATFLATNVCANAIG